MIFGFSLSCSRSDPAERRQEVTSPAPPEDAGTAPALSQKENSGFPSGEHGVPLEKRLRKLHEDADAATSPEERAAAGERLLSLYEALSAENSPHLISIRQDLAARAAQLLLATSPSRSRKSAQDGLELSTAPSVLRANLFLALADADETLGNKENAQKSLVEALAINEKLFETEIEAP